MPTYTVDIPGQGSFDVESQNELSDEQAYQYALQSSQQPSEQPTQQPRQQGTYEQLFGQTAEDPNFVEKFAGITGRRVGSALDAAIGLPGAVGDIVTGGQHGRLDATLRAIQGVASPVSAMLAPIEAAGEEAVTGLTGSDQWGRLAGDVTGMAGTLGLGLLAKGGKLGEMGLRAAQVLGVGKPKTFEEMVIRDPQLRFIAEREPTIGASHLELSARGPQSMAQLALELDRPEMAKVALNQNKANNQQWAEWAKTNQIIGEIPDDPQIVLKNIIFDDKPHGDYNLFETLGTPAHRAAAKDPVAAAAAYEQLLTDRSMQRAITNRETRDARAIAGLTDEQSRSAVITQRLMNADDIATAPEEKISSPIKAFVQYINDKFEVDRKIAIPRARDDIRPRIAKQVRDELGDTATDAELVMEVNKRVIKAVPDNAGIDEMVLQLFPGHYKVMDKKSNILRTADTGLGWKLEVQDLVKAGYDPKDLKVEAQAYLDGELLRKFKGRTKRTLNHLATGLTPNEAEITAAANGEYITQKGWRLFGQLRGESGNAKGYSAALTDMLATYNRSFERWLQVNELKDKVMPMLKDVDKRYPALAKMLKENMDTMWGHRMPGSAPLDNLIRATPLLRDYVSPMALERWSHAGKTGIVNMLLKYNPRFQAVNYTQTLSTLWPIADMSEILQGIKLRSDVVGKELLTRHGITGAGSKIEGWSKGLGPGEKFNQETAFLTMYNRARKFGFSDAQAADYGVLRGNFYSQFMGAVTDQPVAFRKLDPTGMLLMFKRFPVKQMELVMDLMKDKNLPGVGKWLGVNLALGGFKAATLGQTGWLTYKIYKDIEEKYGKGVADVFHTGLPALIGSDISGSVQLMDPPFGETWGEKLGSFAQGPLLGLMSSTVGAAMNSAAVEPNAAKRTLHAIADKNPLLKGLYQIFFEEDKYDFRDTAGRLKWKGDTGDLIKTFLGFKPAGGTMGVMSGPGQMKPGELDTFLDAFMDVTQKRSNVLDYAATRYGAAMAAGIDLGKDLEDAVKKEVDAWNNLWPEFPILGEDIKTRTQRRMKSIKEGTGQRVTATGSKVIRESPTFAPSTQFQQPEVPPPPGQLPFEFFPGGG